MAAKSSIKDVARVMDLPLEESNMLAKLVPDRPGTSLNEMLHISDKELQKKDNITAEDVQNVMQLQGYYNGMDLKSTVLHEAEKLEGTVRNTGIHAAGIIIGPKDLMEIMPLCKQKDIDLYVTQFSGNVVEEAGAIKIDVLGLSNLSIIRDALILIKENHGVDIDIDTIPLDDAKTYKLYQEGDTEGTFQFASAGMKKYLKELKPDNIEDLIAMNALYRPGPIAYIPEFIERKHGRKEIVYDLPEMEDTLKETYGITVYQEQVMLLSQRLANFSKGDADILRKAMGKKQIDVLQKMKTRFLEGCTVNNHPLDKCEKIWTDWEAFAQYAFNKSHSTCYAYLAYQTAFLKANYLPEYMAALLNSQGNIESVSQYMRECKKMGLKVQGPDVNESKKGFSVNREGVIRFGMGAIKGIGEAAVMEILAEREKAGHYEDVFDMVKRLSSRTVSKKTLESLIMAGGLDCFTTMHRGQYFLLPAGETQTNLEKIIRFGQQVTSDTFTSNSLFGDVGMPEISLPKLHTTDEWTLTEKLEKEKEMVGIYISAHPLDSFQFEMANYGFTSLADIEKENLRKRQLRVAGYVSFAQHLISKKGTLWGKFKLIDFNGEHEFTLFKEDYLKFKDMLIQDNKIMVTGTYQNRWNDENQWEFKIQSMYLLEDVKKLLTKRLNMTVPLERLDSAFMTIIQKYAETAGKCELGIQVVDKASDNTIRLYTPHRKIELSDRFLDELTKLEGIVYHVVTI
jgi:DNA polymerase-3 subunit alpha